MSKFDNRHDYYIDKAKRMCHKSMTHPLFRTFSKENLTFFCFSSVLSCIIAEKIWWLRVFIVLLYAVRQVGLAGYVCTTESL